MKKLRQYNGVNHNGSIQVKSYNPDCVILHAEIDRGKTYGRITTKIYFAIPTGGSFAICALEDVNYFLNTDIPFQDIGNEARENIDIIIKTHAKICADDY